MPVLRNIMAAALLLGATSAHAQLELVQTVFGAGDFIGTGTNLLGELAGGDAIGGLPILGGMLSEDLSQFPLLGGDLLGGGIPVVGGMLGGDLLGGGIPVVGGMLGGGGIPVVGVLLN